ncbi:uncharacterized protein ALTATR162_LOCUS421 [Alternaria atra]|uniref:Uncharacterized protein n=1 Tax=Alternaria atra TaxID=119953 RepID=A0A8J2HV82_9PLEO|nr:uncharacterized protein ALTATR162_LOCUS421 [Alternaria atra]CAG5138691.1 unnamed protein product [Alternaria atra]
MAQPPSLTLISVTKGWHSPGGFIKQTPHIPYPTTLDAIQNQHTTSSFQGGAREDRSHFSPVSNNSDHVVIGVILSNGEARGDRYKCNAPSCSGANFGRLADLKRHHASLHGGVGRKGQRIWCSVEASSQPGYRR